MKDLADIKADKHIKSIKYYNNAIVGELKLPLCRGTFIFGWNELWDEDKPVEHLSFSAYNSKHIPSWDELCMLKDIFWDDEESCFQYFPKKSEYVNIKENCLHIWKFKEV